MEDFHKAVKYKVWSSKSSINKKINFLYKSSGKNSILMIFSCAGEGKINGLARVSSNVFFSANFGLWSSNFEWASFFEIEWLIVKDMPFKSLQLNAFTVSDSQVPIFSMRDGDTLETDEAVGLLKEYVNHKPLSSVVDHFEFYDMREMNYVLYKHESGN